MLLSRISAHMHGAHMHEACQDAAEARTTAPPARRVQLVVSCTASSSTYPEQFRQGLGQALVLVREEGCGNSLLAGTACAANAMHVVIDVGGQVEVDDVHDVRNIQASGSHVCGHKHRGAS